MVYLNDYARRVESAGYLDISVEFVVVVAQYSPLIFIVCLTVVFFAFTPKVIGKFSVTLPLSVLVQSIRMMGPEISYSRFGRFLVCHYHLTTLDPNSRGASKMWNPQEKRTIPFRRTCRQLYNAHHREYQMHGNPDHLLRLCQTSPNQIE